MLKKVISIKKINAELESDARKVILDTESRYRGQLFALVERILEKRDTNMVLLSGPSCAGKTTSARLLKEILEQRGRHVITISMDDFFINRKDTPLLPDGTKDFDSPQALNLDLMKSCFTKLFKEGKAMFPEYDFVTGINNPEAKEIQLKYNSIIVFEGLHALNPLLIDKIGTTKYYKIYVNALSHFKLDKQVMNSVDIRLFRRIVRDIARRQYSVKHTLENWHAVCDAEDKYITKYRKQADAVVNTTHEYELGILKNAFEEMISKGQAKYSQLPFAEIVKSADPVDKCLLPDTTLMWEFVDAPSPDDKLAYEIDNKITHRFKNIREDFI